MPKSPVDTENETLESDNEGASMIDEPELAHSHQGKSGIAWLDFSLPLSVVALSVGSLLTAQHTGKTMENLVTENSRLVRANSTPLLQFSTGNVENDQRVITLSVSNVGTGTARVFWFEVYKNKVRQQDPTDLIDYTPKAEEQDYLPTRPVGGTYFPADEARTFISWRYPAGSLSQSKWRDFDDSRLQISVKACYCSILGECWTSNLGADTPLSVKSCNVGNPVNFRESPLSNTQR